MVVKVDVIVHNTDSIVKVLDLDMPDQFFLQMGEEILSWRVIQTATFPGHGRDYPQLSSQGLVSRGLKLGSLIALNNHTHLRSKVWRSSTHGL